MTAAPSATPSALAFQAGDAVIERIPPDGYVSLSGAPRPALSRRSGRVVAVRQKLNARGRRVTYVEVLWDGRRSPSTHAACRLIRQGAAT